MDFLINLGNLLLVWTLVIVALVFATGTFLTVRAQRKAALSKIKRPRLTSGEVVAFEEVGSGKGQSFVVTSIRFDGSRRYVTLQDQTSWGNDNRHSDLP